jgi:Fe-S cluster assembly iron-binding protein IscA
MSITSIDRRTRGIETDGKGAMSLVTLDPGAGQAVKSLLSERGVQGPIRIEVQFTGCCDPSLGLIVDTVRESDLVEELDGLTFVISPETHQLVGEVRISYVDEAGKKGFVLTSSKPISEWDGFATSSIRM